MPIEAVHTDKVPPSTNPFSFAIKANGFIFVSGQVGKNAEGKIVEGFGPQVTQAMENLKAILEDAGAAMDQIVKIKISVTDISRIPELNEIYKPYFSGVFPARAAVEVSRLGGTAEVEIEAVAVDG